MRKTRATKVRDYGRTNGRQTLMLVKKIRFGWVIAFALIAGSVFAFSSAEAAPTPLAACQTVMAGSYILTGNIKTTGNCFVIGASGVAIDLGGFSITGDGRTGAAITDNGSPFSQIIISHGSISKFQNGINLSKSTYVTIEFVDSSHNKGDGILIGDGGATNGFSNTITSVTTSFNSGDGIHINNCCNLIAKVTSSNNKGNGIVSSQCCTLATQITASNNHGNGVELDGCCSFLTSATVTSNKGFGFTSDKCCNSITGGTIAKNGRDGAALGDEDNSINQTTVETNKGNGISATSFDNLVNGGAVETNSKDGLSFTSRGFQLVTNATVEKNKGNGITLSAGEGKNGVVLSTVQSNHKAGVVVTCPSNLYMLTSTSNKKGSNLVTTGAGCVDLDSSDTP